MNAVRTAAITAGLVGAFGLGVWIGPHLTNGNAPEMTTALSPITATSSALEPQPLTHRTVDRARPVTAAHRGPAITASAGASGMGSDTPELHQRLKPLLKSGANMELAAAGFRSAEQFATVAHASQNTDVPFMLLKHRVLNEGDTLVAAIRKSRPEANAVVEVDRARAEARSDLSSIN